MANNLSLSNVINVTLVPTIAGLSEFNTANLLLYSTEATKKSWGDEKYRVYYSASSVAEDFGVDSLTYKMALGVFSQAPNILSNSGALIIALKEGNESQVEAFNRLKTKVLFCGWITTDSIANDLAAIDVTESSGASIEVASLATAVNAENNKIQFVVSNVQADIEGVFTGIKDMTLQKTRCLFYGGTETEAGLWEPLIGLAKSFGLQKAGELCSKIIENDEICQKVSDALGQVVDKITGTGESE